MEKFKNLIYNESEKNPLVPKQREEMAIHEKHDVLKALRESETGQII